MPGFTLITGNRLEYLAERCAADLMSDPLPPLTGEVISVQSMGMMKWLSLRLAEHAGIWANCGWIFPNKMSSMLLNGFFPGAGNERYFDRDSIPWKIMNIIESSGNSPVFSQPAGYIKDDPSGIKLYQLSSALADVFDQYMTFRPEMISAWDKGADKDQWQAALWRMLTADMEAANPPALLNKLKGMFGDRNYRPEGPMPARLTLFGISYLPLYHINLLFAASRFIDIRMYMLNPSAEYWGDILREKDKVKKIAGFPIPSSDPETDLHLDTGNPLLASMGRPGRDFIRAIFATDCATEEYFFEPEGDTLLAMVQRDIYSMTDRARTGELYDATPAQDKSIVINSCHSPMREAEVLRDYILDLFSSDPALDPRDIIVMVPDIEKYSGCIESVFSGRDSGIDIPFRIADRKPAGAEPLIAAFFRLLDLPGTRFTASSVLSFLDCTAIMDRFGFTAEDRTRINLWIAESGIRWGAGAEFKERLNLPAEEANTFSAGIKRLITGLIMAGDDLCLDVLPAASVDPGDASLLGRFITYVKTLEKIHDHLAAAHTLDEWGDIFMFIIDSLFSADGIVPVEIMPVSDVAQLLRSVRESSAYGGTVKIAAVKEFAESRVTAPRSVRDFISGSLTFCEMLPMRSIPCRVVCLLGMDTRSFPGRSRLSSFDLIAANPRSGDRSVRDEERYMFLETIISAREKLYISYTGQNIVNNTESDPSTVVSELIDYIASFSAGGDPDRVKKELVTRQKLLRYSPEYFVPGGSLYSYSAGSMREAAAASAGSCDQPDFMSGRLAPVAEKYIISIDELSWALRNPAKTLCNKRLGITLEIRDETPVDDEPFSLDSRSLRRLDSALLAMIVSGEDTGLLYRRMKAAGELPHGSAGRAVFSIERDRAVKFISMLPGVFDFPEPLPGCELDINGVIIKMKPGLLYNSKQVFASMSKAGAADILRAWISHLALCDAGAGERTELYSGELKNGEYKIKCMAWDKIDDAHGILSELCGYYKEGMVSPVELFPASSLAYVQGMRNPGKGEPEEKAKSDAMKAFFGYGHADSSDPYIQKIFGPDYVPGPKFRKTAVSVYDPVYGNLAEDN